jgi:hypothetical protein
MVVTAVYVMGKTHWFEIWKYWYILYRVSDLFIELVHFLNFMICLNIVDMFVINFVKIIIIIGQMIFFV